MSKLLRWPADCVALSCLQSNLKRFDVPIVRRVERAPQAALASAECFASENRNFVVGETAAFSPGTNAVRRCVVPQPVAGLNASIAGG
jgi:hypothetical protein